MRIAGPLLTFLLLFSPVPARCGPSLDELVVSPGIGLAVFQNLWIDGAQVAMQPNQVLRYARTGPALVDLGVLPGGVGVTAVHLEPGGDILFAISTDAQLGGTFFETRDVIRFDGSAYSLHFDGEARGIPAGIGVDGFSRLDGNDLLSFDDTVTLGIGTVDVVPVSVPENAVLIWTDEGIGVAFSPTVDGIPAGVNVDGVAALADGSLMLSFDQPVAVDNLSFGVSETAIVRRDPNVLSRIAYLWSRGVDLADHDPDWGGRNFDALHAEIGTARVEVPQPAEVSVLVRASEPPRAYELRLGCGAHAITRITGAIALNPDVAASAVTIGDCTTVSCPGLDGFGPNVDTASISIEFPPFPPPTPRRQDAVYFSFDGDGEPWLCRPGESTLLAEIGIRGGEKAIPAPLPTGEGALSSFREDGALLRPDQIAYSAGQGLADWTVRVRPALDSTLGLDYEVVLDGPAELSRIGIALLLPDGVFAPFVSFGGCTEPIGPNNERGCNQAPGLGPWVDDLQSSTVGPSPDLTLIGGHPAALYLDLVGSRSTSALPALNFAARRVLLGTLTYDPAVPPADRIAPQVLIGGTGSADGALPPTNDLAGTPKGPIEGGGGGIDPFNGGSVGDDSDPDDTDPCPGSPDNTDSGGVDTQDPDGIGDDCQCGDVTSAAVGPPGVLADPEGIIDESDVQGLREALAGIEEVSEGAQPKCSVNGPVDATEAESLPLRSDCEISDVVVLRRVLAGEEEGPGPLELQQCDAP